MEDSREENIVSSASLMQIRVFRNLLEMTYFLT